MIIDFHTHIFPDELAPRALDKLSVAIDHIYPTTTDGTVGGLLRQMDEGGIDVSVVQPVLTSSSQVRTINTWARSICSDRLVSFGAVYPHDESYKNDIDLVVELGLKGLKLHPEYQNFVVDDEKMLRIYDYALSKGLILLFHAGFDPGFSPPFKSTPQQFARIINALQGGVIVAAHLGGHAQWDEVEEYLVGSEIYLDTSMGFKYFPEEQFLRIVKNHGANKILFASDSPWSYTSEEIAFLKALPLLPEETDAILGGNARRILQI
ncbi:MAG: amidohydrolase family protein [Coriobacteriales bacterium]|jgi:predicted TIM-barrel fold metal-dependent hydrolase|nr:amidohydrolase family protein [Coriobacteriales bacterium]